ncbi:hypothetical protein OAV88_03500 [bacterium]|nr:hypothetical protein [bacterium]
MLLYFFDLTNSLRTHTHTQTTTTKKTCHNAEQPRKRRNEEKPILIVRRERSEMNYIPIDWRAW